MLKDHAMKLVKEDDNNAGDKEELKKEADKLKLNVLTMPDVTKNLLVIKYLRKLMGNVKIVLAVSSWDVKEIIIQLKIISRQYALLFTTT